MAYVPKVNSLMGNAQRPAPAAPSRYTPKANPLVDPNFDPKDFAAKHTPKPTQGEQTASVLKSVGSSLGSHAPHLATSAELNTVKTGPSPQYTNPLGSNGIWGSLAQQAGQLVNQYLPGVTQANSVLGSITGVTAAKNKSIDTMLKTGKITNAQAMDARQQLLDEGKWSGNTDAKGNTNYNLSPLDNVKKAAGEAAELTSEVVPMPAFKAKSVLGKLGSGTVQGATAGTAHSVGSQLVNKGNVDLGETAAGAGLGAAFGAGASAAGQLVKRLATGKTALQTAPDVVPSVKAVPKVSLSPTAKTVASTGSNEGGLLQGLKEAQPAAEPTSAAETVGKGPTNELTIKGLVAKPDDMPVSKQPSAPGENWSSRVKQYEQHLQETIKNTEESPEYQASLKESGGQKVIGNKEVYDQAAKLGPMNDAEITAAKPGDKVDAVTVVRAKATLNQAAQEFTDAWKSNSLDDKTLGDMASRMAKLEAGYKVISAEPGRATQIQNSFIDKGYQLQQKLADLENTTKGPNKRQVIKEQLDEFEEGLKNEGMNPTTAKKFVDMFTEYATAAKLTSPLTHFVNVASNLLTLPQRAAEDLVKMGLRIPQGKTGLGQAKYVFGTGKGLASASKQFAADMKKALTGKDVGTDLGKGETPGAIPGRLGGFVRMPFNFLGAADGFFKNVLKDSEIHQAAYGQAWKEGFRGSELKGRVDELAKTPTEDMAVQAKKVADEFTFNNDPGRIATGLTNIMTKVPLLRLLIPFVRTPTNIAQFQLRRSAFGLFSPKNLSDLVGKSSSSASREDAVARLAVGGAMSVAGAMAAINFGDNITGAAPADQGAKDAFYSQGKKPYAIKIGDTWYQYNRFQPVGMYLTQAVGLRDALLDGNSKTAGNIFASFAGTTAKGLADLPFVSGISSVIDALNNPSQLSTVNKAVGGIFKGMIPNLSADIASSGDNTQRAPKSILDQIKMSIPGLRQQVGTQTNTFGQTEGATSDDPFVRGFIKITSKDKPNALFDALKAADDYSPSPPSTKERGQTLDQPTFIKFQTRSGTLFAQKVQQAINDSHYKSLTPDRKQRELSSALSDARSQALDELLGKQPKKATTPIKHYK